MNTPLEIAFNGMDHSEFIEAAVRKHFSNIERHYGNLTSCYVAISAPHKSHRHGNQYEVHIKAHLPGADIAVSHNPGDKNTHDDMNVLLRDSFHAFETQLEKVKSKKKSFKHDDINTITSDGGDQVGPQAKKPEEY